MQRQPWRAIERIWWRCRRNHRKGEAARQRYGAQNAYADYREMIEKEQPDIVCVATRPPQRAEVAIFAAENGVKGYLRRKPLCCSMEEADAMVDAVERNGTKFNYGNAAALHAVLSQDA